MSKIKQLRENNNHVINLIDVLELFSPDKKSKYTETLLRLMNGTSNLNNHFEDIKISLTNEFDFITKEDLEKYTPIQLMVVHRFIDSFFNYSDLKSFRRFCEYNERGLITQNDLTRYKTFDDLLLQLSIADMKVETKNLENEVIKVYEDEEWLLVRPLTYLSSKKYGSNTKWCTTSEGNPEYFIKYSSKGVLIYCINKITGYKVASFRSLDKSDPEFSWWNQKDSRIDSLETELTSELRELIGKLSKDVNAKTNRFLLSDDQRIVEDKLNSSNIFKLHSPVQEVEMDVMEQPAEPTPIHNEPVNGRYDSMVRRNEERRARERRLLGELTETSPEPETIVERMRLVSNNEDTPDVNISL